MNGNLNSLPQWGEVRTFEQQPDFIRAIPLVQSDGTISRVEILDVQTKSIQIQKSLTKTAQAFIGKPYYEWKITYVMDAKTRIENNCFLDSNWEPEKCSVDMTVPEMIKHIYKNRRSEAVAPNGNTCPFLTVEEWTKIYKWVQELEAKQ